MGGTLNEVLHSGLIPLGAFYVGEAEVCSPFPPEEGRSVIDSGSGACPFRGGYMRYVMGVDILT